MQRRHNLAHFILAGVTVLGLTLLIVCVDARAQIAFSSNRDGDYEIYVMDINGGNPQNLTDHPHADINPSWSPNGKRIVFMSARDGHVDDGHGSPIYEIYVMDADGDNPQRLTNNPSDDRSPSWSPDGKRIAFVSDRDGLSFDIFVMEIDGSNLQNLTNNPFNDRDPSWSPEGKRIVFSARRDGHFENELAITSEIYVMDADGGNLQRLTNNPNADVGPAWLNSPFSVSPAGKQFTMWGRVKQVDR